MSTPARYLLLAQTGFFLSLVVCVLLDSAGLHSNHGWSYYEGRSQTFVPYLLGLGWCVLLIALAAGLLSRSAAPAGFPAALKLLSVLLLLDVATPDTVDAAFSWAHDLTSALLFLYELGLAVWLVRAVWPTRVARLLLVVQFTGGLVAMFSFLELIPLLGVGMLVFQLSFGVLLIAVTARFHEVADDASVRTEDVPAAFGES